MNTVFLQAGPQASHRVGADGIKVTCGKQRFFVAAQPNPQI
jgi:hypothetical protein